MNTFKTSANGRKFIERFEGLSLKAYQDSAGVWTIGYGHTSAAGLPNIRPGMVITQEQADTILGSDLAAVEIDVNHHVTYSPLIQQQFDALVSFDFNTGALDRSNVLRDLNLSRLDKIQADLLMWDHVTIRGKLTVLLGLQKRRKAEWILFSTGEVTGP